MANGPSKAQQVYERVEALIADGASRVDAFRQIAEEFEQPLDSIRGAYYLHRREVVGETGPRRRSRRRETTEADAIAAAVTTLERSINDIQQEVEEAQERANEAEREYQELSESSVSRIEAIRAKIEVLTATEAPEPTTPGSAKV